MIPFTFLWKEVGIRARYIECVCDTHTRVLCCPSMSCRGPRGPQLGRPVCRDHPVHSCFPSWWRPTLRGHSSHDRRLGTGSRSSRLSSGWGVFLSACLASTSLARTDHPALGPTVHFQTNTIHHSSCFPRFWIIVPCYMVPSVWIRNEPCSTLSP